MNQTTGVILCVIEGAGLLITIGFGIAAFKGWRKAKKAADNLKAKVDHVTQEFENFATRLRGFVG